MNGNNFWATRNGRYAITAVACVVIWGLLFVASTNSQELGSVIALICAFFGWRALNRIQPAMFVWMPLIGWIIYFVVKFLLSYFIGIFVAPFVLSKKIAAVVADNPEAVDAVVGSLQKTAGELQRGDDENATDLTKGCKIWFGVILIGQAGGILLGIYSMVELNVDLAIGLYTIGVGIIGIASIILMLVQHKILGFYIYVGLAVVAFVVNVVLGTDVVSAIISAVAAPAITYFFIRKNAAVLR